jgi:hypothetical protein
LGLRKGEKQTYHGDAEARRTTEASDRKNKTLPLINRDDTDQESTAKVEKDWFLCS